MTKIKDELRKKFPNPRDAIKALGLDESLLNVPRLAFDGAHKMKPTVLEYLALTRTALACNPLLAADAKIDYAPIFKGLNTTNIKARRPTIVSDLKAALKGKTIATDVSIEHVNAMLDKLEHTAEPKVLDESVSAAQHGAMGAAAGGHSNLGIPKSVGEEFMRADKGKSFDSEGFMAKLREHGMDDAAIKDCMDMLPHEMGHGHDEHPENALDETPEEKAEREKKEKEAADKKAADEAAAAADKHAKDKAMDERLKGMVTTDAMTTAINAAVATERKNNQATAEARAFVQPYVGELPLALDSAEKVHRAAAKIIGIEDAETVHASALPALIKAIGKPAGATILGDGDQRMAIDSAASKNTAQRWPDAARISLG